MFPSVFNPSLCLLSTIHFSLVLLFQAYVASRILPQQALSSGCSYHATVGDCMVGRVIFFFCGFGHMNCITQSHSHWNNSKWKNIRVVGLNPLWNLEFFSCFLVDNSNQCDFLIWYYNINSSWSGGRMGYWLRGHEGERNYCFSKIQLVGHKFETKQL